MKKKHILLAVTGLSPQVVTETLYALHKSQKPMPERLILITTQIGANEARKHLIDKARIAQFCKDYQLDEICLLSSDICIIPDDDGIVTDDVNADRQMNALADFICSKVQKLTTDNNTIIHASLAGGRKTMGYFLGMAMGFYARKGDSLSHVLVSEGYESSDFFYPTPYSSNIQNYRGTILDAQYAKVWLTHIPFVRLRDDLPKSLLDGKSSYSETVKLLNYNANDLSVKLNIDKKIVSCSQLNCQMPVREFTFYLWFCHRAVQQEQGLFIPDKSNPEEDYATEFLRFYEQIVDEFKYEKLSLLLKQKKGMSKSFFEELKSRTNRIIVNTFGQKIAQQIIIKKAKKDYHVVTEKNKKVKREKHRFAIKLAADKISYTEKNNDISA